MDFNSIKDPLVRDYVMKKYGSNKVADAQAEADTASTAGVVAGAADSLSNAFNQPVALQNRMQDLGKAPTMVGGDQQKTDVSGLQKQAQAKLAQARSDEDDAVKMAFEQRRAELAAEAAGRRQAIEDERWQKKFDQDERAMQIRSQSKATDPLVEMMRMEQYMKLKREAQQDQDALNVPGYSRTGEVYQSPAEAKDARTAIGTANNMFKGLELLKQQMAENGSFEWGGAAGADMAATANDLRLQAKELYNLGVLNGPDLQLMLKQIPDTESLGSMFTRDSTAKAQLDSTATAMKRKIEEAMKARGYAPKANTQTAGPKTGDVMDGYVFMGGDPADPASWKKQ